MRNTTQLSVNFHVSFTINADIMDGPSNTVPNNGTTTQSHEKVTVLTDALVLRCVPQSRPDVDCFDEMPEF